MGPFVAGPRSQLSRPDRKKSARHFGRLFRGRALTTKAIIDEWPIQKSASLLP
jgi:hypothetical protein